jgi:hypothetical protein
LFLNEAHEIGDGDAHFVSFFLWKAPAEGDWLNIYAPYHVKVLGGKIYDVAKLAIINAFHQRDHQDEAVQASLTAVFDRLHLRVEQINAADELVNVRF